MNSATMKLCALADIVTKLMLKNRTYEWEQEIQNLPRQLESVSIEELLQVGSSQCTSCPQLMWQNEIFTRTSSEGELKLLVSIANKTAYHGIKTYYARCWATTHWIGAGSLRGGITCREKVAILCFLLAGWWKILKKKVAHGIADGLFRHTDFCSVSQIPTQ
jgi:hypothetical protein